MRPSTRCPKCKLLIANSGYSRHLNACDGSGTFWSKFSFSVKEEWKLETGLYACPNCSFCGTKQALASHYAKSHSSKEAKRNTCKPKNYRNGMQGKIAWNRGHTKETCEITRRISEKVSITLRRMYDSGELKPKTGEQLAVFRTDAHRKLMQSYANARFEKGQGNAKGAWMLDSFGSKCYLGSSYEVRVANILNELEILWLRPNFLWYMDDTGFRRKYFPDLYLPDFNLYLDPKNSFLLQRHKRKLQLVREQNGIRLETITEDQLTKSYIQELIGRPTRIRTQDIR